MHGSMSNTKNAKSTEEDRSFAEAALMRCFNARNWITKGVLLAVLLGVGVLMLDALDMIDVLPSDLFALANNTSLTSQANSSTPTHLSRKAVKDIPAPTSAIPRPVSDTFNITHPVWWFAPFFSKSGMGREAACFILALYRFLPHGKLWIKQAGDNVDAAVLAGYPEAEAAILTATHRPQLSPETQHAIAVCHYLPLFWGKSEVGSCGFPGLQHAYVIGRVMHDTVGLPDEFVSRCDEVDEVWVPSEWAKEEFSLAGVNRSKIFVVGEPIDTDVFDPQKHNPAALPFGQRVDLTAVGLGFNATNSTGAVSGIINTASASASPNRPASVTSAPAADTEALRCATGRRRFSFLSNFKFEARKGWDVLLAAYFEEFTAADCVDLYIITQRYVRGETEPFPDLVGTAAKAVLGGHPNRSASSLPAVYLMTDYIPQVDLPGYYKAADAFVLSSRGEGWGLPVVEAMAMELPVIATNWSGLTAFLTPDVGYPLALDGLVNATGWLHDGFQWAQPSATHLRSLMREVWRRGDDVAARGKRARQRMVERFSPKVMAAELVQHFRRIEDKLRRRETTTSQSLHP